MVATQATDAVQDGATRRHSIAIVVLDTTLALDTAVAVAIFGPRPTAFASIRDEAESPYEVFLCGGETSDLRSVGFATSDLEPWSRVADADTIIVPGLDEPGRRRDPEAHDAIATAAGRGARLVSLCAGAFVLGHSGVLAGHRVTTHWALADEFRGPSPTWTCVTTSCSSTTARSSAPAACWRPRTSASTSCVRTTVSRTPTTCPASSSARRTARADKRSTAPSERTRARGTLGPLMEWALEHLDEELTLSTLAAKAHLSTRTLSRRFEAETGHGALQWIAERRVERARALLEETSMSVTEVAFATGFGSLASFRRQFTRLTGATPSAYRHTFKG